MSPNLAAVAILSDRGAAPSAGQKCTQMAVAVNCETIATAAFDGLVSAVEQTQKL